jgi:hypothetical protein
VKDEATTHDPLAPTTVGGSNPSRWMNGTVTRTLLASVLVAALDHGGLRPDPVYDIAWIIVTLAATGLIRAYTAFVTCRSRRESTCGRLCGCWPASGRWSRRDCPQW